jgi:hypothetical protein
LYLYSESATDDNLLNISQMYRPPMFCRLALARPIADSGHVATFSSLGILTTRSQSGDCGAVCVRTRSRFVTLPSLWLTAIQRQLSETCGT